MTDAYLVPSMVQWEQTLSRDESCIGELCPTYAEKVDDDVDTVVAEYCDAEGIIHSQSIGAIDVALKYQCRGSNRTQTCKVERTARAVKPICGVLFELFETELPSIVRDHHQRRILQSPTQLK